MAHRLPASHLPINRNARNPSSNSQRPAIRVPSRSPDDSRFISSGPSPMSIPGVSRPSEPPPPLPPPTQLPDLDAGRDLGWEWGNKARRAELSPGASAWERRDSYDKLPKTSELWDRNRRRESSTSVENSEAKPFTGFDEFTRGMDFHDEVSSSSAGALYNQLQGSRPLDEQNRKYSSHGYDNKIVSKLGGPNTPTRSSTASSTDKSPAVLSSARPDPQATRPPQLKTLSISDRSTSASSDSPLKVTSPHSNRFAFSPQSAAASPGFFSSTNSTHSFATDRLSPTFDSNSVASSHTSLGGSLMSDIGVKQQYPKPKAMDSNLSLAMMAVSAAKSATGLQSNSYSLNLHSHSHSHSHSAASSSSNISQQQSQPGAGTGGGRTGAGVGGSGIAGGFGSFKRGSFEPGNNLTTANPGNLQAISSNLTLFPPDTSATATATSLAETGGEMQHLQLDDYPHHPHPPPPNSARPNSNRLQSQPSRSGMKRKTPPLSTDAPNEEDDRRSASAQAQQQQGAASEQQRRTPGQPHPLAKRASPNYHAPVHNLYSSYSSTSSAGFAANGHYPQYAVGASGMSAPPSGHDRSSPAAMANAKPDGHASSPYPNPLSLDPGLQAAQDPQSQSQFSLDQAQQLAAAASQKISAESANRQKQQSTPKHASHFICDCCPKKPKKFDTADELRHHQSEKQYVCHYCRNRFKNKNEAERHQNSLHLRRHSWSCATLERNFEAAFHPCTAAPPNSSTHAQQPQPPPPPAAFDVCGYCGEEFPNIPQPDWLARGDHLTNVHKFSECNQSKKFYRADHFRQHLKHSHGGTSGKWTNMLETACMKEEPPVTPEAQNQEQLRLQQQQQQAQAAHVAKAAQAAAQQAQQATQQTQQTAHHGQVEQPALTSYQAAQLQGASGAPVANMMQSASRQGPYPVMSSDMQYSAIPEEGPK